jgi:hypothetical protein
MDIVQPFAQLRAHWQVDVAKAQLKDARCTHDVSRPVLLDF